MKGNAWMFTYQKKQQSKKKRGMYLETGHDWQEKAGEHWSRYVCNKTTVQMTFQ